MNASAPLADWPAHTVGIHALPDGRPVLVRPQLASDAQGLQDFVRRLSPVSRRMRFQAGLAELTPALLEVLMRVDQQRSAAFVAVVRERGRRTMIGEARYAPSADLPDAAEFAVAVADEYQGAGLGTLLIRTLLEHARRCEIARIHGDVLQDNAGMLRLSKRLGFALRGHPDGAWLARAIHELRGARDLPGQARAAQDQPAAASLGRRAPAGRSSALISA